MVDIAKIERPEQQKKRSKLETFATTTGILGNTLSGVGSIQKMIKNKKETDLLSIYRDMTKKHADKGK